MKACEAEKTSSREDFDSLFHEWPTSVADSKPRALQAWNDLAREDQRNAAVSARRYASDVRASGRSRICSLDRYLIEKRWEQLKGGKVLGGPFLLVDWSSPLWMIERFRLLFGAPEVTDYPFTCTERKLLEAGTFVSEELRLQKQAKMGWPRVNAMDDRAFNHGRGITVSPALEQAVELMEQIEVDSTVYSEWREEFEKRGWPWPTFPSERKLVWLPAGDPQALKMFEAELNRMIGNNSDEGQK